MSRLTTVIVILGSVHAGLLTVVAVSLTRTLSLLRVALEDAALRNESANRAEAIGIVDNHAPLPAGLLRFSDDDLAEAQSKREKWMKQARRDPDGK